MATIEIDKKIRKEKEILLEFDSNVKDLRAQLNEQFKCLDVKLENEMAILTEIQDFFKRRSEIEIEYSRNLEKLVKNIQLRHKNDKVKRDHWSLYTPYNCWQNLLDRCREDGKNHASLADLYMSVITPRVSQIVDDNRRIHLKCKDIGSKCHDEVFKVLNELITAMKSYHVLNTAYKLSEQKLKLAETQMNKLEIKDKISASKKKIITKTGRRQEKYLSDKLNVDRARNEYILCLASANTTIYRFFQDDIHDLIDCGSIAFQPTLAGTLQLYLQGEDRIVYSKQEGMRDTLKTIENLDSKNDKQKFIEAYNTAFQLPSKIPFRQHRGDQFNSFIPNPEFGGELNVRYAQLSSRLSGLRTENDEIWKTLETAESVLLNVISAYCSYNVASLFSKDSSSTSNSSATNTYQRNALQPYTSDLKPTIFTPTSNTSSTELSPKPNTAILPSSTTATSSTSSNLTVQSGDPLYVGGVIVPETTSISTADAVNKISTAPTSQVSSTNITTTTACLPLFTNLNYSSSNTSKSKTERLEIEDFYLKKFQEYLLSGDLIARLQAKFLIIHKALQEISRQSKHNLLSDLELKNASVLTPHEGAYLFGPTQGPVPLAPVPMGPASKRKRVIGASFAGGKIPKLFGGSLEDYLTVTGQDIPLIILSTIRVITLYGLHHQGIFRVSGSQIEINEFKNAFERGEDPLIDVKDSKDINSVSGVLKLYLRELREPLFPIYMFDQLVNLGSKITNSAGKQSYNKAYLNELRDLLATLPKPVYITMRYLFSFLNHLSQYSDENMMDPYNLAVCFGPTMMPVPTDRAQVQSQANVNELIKVIIQKQDYIFPVDHAALMRYTGLGSDPAISASKEIKDDEEDYLGSRDDQLADKSATVPYQLPRNISNTLLTHTDDMMIKALSGSNNYYSDEGPFFDKFCRYNFVNRDVAVANTSPVVVTDSGAVPLNTTTNGLTNVKSNLDGSEQSSSKKNQQIDDHSLTDDSSITTERDNKSSKRSTDQGSSNKDDSRSKAELSEDADGEDRGDIADKESEPDFLDDTDDDEVIKYSVAKNTPATSIPSNKASPTERLRDNNIVRSSGVGTSHVMGGLRRSSLSFLVPATRQNSKSPLSDDSKSSRESPDVTTGDASSTLGRRIIRKTGVPMSRSFYRKRSQDQEGPKISLFSRTGSQISPSKGVQILGGVNIGKDMLAVARYPFKARNENEISFEKGDILRPLYKINSDWWKAVLVKAGGAIKSNVKTFTTIPSPLSNLNQNSATTADKNVPNTPSSLLSSPETLSGIRYEGLVPHIYLTFVNTNLEPKTHDRSESMYMTNFFRDSTKRGKSLHPATSFTSPLSSSYRHSFHLKQSPPLPDKSDNGGHPSERALQLNGLDEELSNFIGPPPPPYVSTFEKSATADQQPSTSVNASNIRTKPVSEIIHRGSWVNYKQCQRQSSADIIFEHKPTGQKEYENLGKHGKNGNVVLRRKASFDNKITTPIYSDSLKDRLLTNSSNLPDSTNKFKSASQYPQTPLIPGDSTHARTFSEINRPPNIVVRPRDDNKYDDEIHANSCAPLPSPPLHHLQIRNVGIFQHPQTNTTTAAAVDYTTNKRCQLQRQGAFSSSRSHFPPSTTTTTTSYSALTPTVFEGIKETLISPIGIDTTSNATHHHLAHHDKGTYNDRSLEYQLPYDGSQSIIRDIDEDETITNNQTTSLGQPSSSTTKSLLTTTARIGYLPALSSSTQSTHQPAYSFEAATKPEMVTSKSLINSKTTSSTPEPVNMDNLQKELDSIIKNFQTLPSALSPHQSTLPKSGLKSVSSRDIVNTPSAIKSFKSSVIDDSTPPPVTQLIKGFENQNENGSGVSNSNKRDFNKIRTTKKCD